MCGVVLWPVFGKCSEVTTQLRSLLTVQPLHYPVPYGVLPCYPGPLVKTLSLPCHVLLVQALERREELTPWMICNMLWGSARVV